MIQFKASLQWLWMKIEGWASSRRSTVHMCLFFAAFEIGLALVLWDVGPIDTVAIWLLAAYLAWRRVDDGEIIQDLSAIVEIQTAILKTLIPPRHTGGESNHVDLGEGTSPPGSMPSP